MANEPNDGTNPVVPQMLVAKEVSKILRVCPKTLYTLTAAGEIAVARIGRRVLYDIRDIRAYVESKKTGRTVVRDAGTGAR